MPGADMFDALVMPNLDALVMPDLDALISDEDNPEPTGSGQNIRTHVQGGKVRFDMRRYKSEQALLAHSPWHLHAGDILHCMSYGDVDMLTYVRHILRQQKAEYMLVSSWCYGVEDVSEIGQWVKAGLVGRLDAYMGEIARASYSDCQDELEAVTASTGGRCGVFKNHSKVAVILGERYDCVITSSANINTNPRCENTVITCDTSVAEWYKAYFDDVRPFNGVPEGWEPYRRR